MGQSTSSVSNANNINRGQTSSSGTSYQPSSRARSAGTATERRRTCSGAGSSSGYRPKPSRSHAAPVSGRVSWPHHTILPLDSLLQPANNQQRSSDFHFNAVHGKNIVLSTDSKTALRMGSFCNALVFTYRAIHVGEILHFELIQNTAGWSGVLRFGYTSQDPTSFRTTGIPKYACPDLTARPGNWAKAVRESCAKDSNVLNFVLSEDGTVYFSVNQEPFMEFFNGVDTSRPLWGVIDVYGNTTGVRVVDTFPTSNRISSRGASVNSGFQLLSDLLPGSSRGSPATSNSGARSNAPKPEPLPLHPTHGFNIILTEGKAVADRKATSVSGGITFTSRPIECDERVLVKILAVNHCYFGHMGVGLTSCDPATLDPDTLPLEAEDVCDRKEYWVMSRDYEALEEGACLGFTLGRDGRFHMAGSEGVNDKVLMHVDTSTQLWMFFDLYGTTQTVKVLGSLKNMPPPPPPLALPISDGEANDINLNIFDEAQGAFPTTEAAVTEIEPVPTPPPRISSASGGKNAVAAAKVKRVPPPRPSKPPLRQENECTVCFENPPEAVFYRCGHVCCCMDCGTKLKERGDPCPLCRAPIKDLIKFYKM